MTTALPRPSGCCPTTSRSGATCNTSTGRRWRRRKPTTFGICGNGRQLLSARSAGPAQRHPVGVLLGQEVADRQLDGRAGRVRVQPVDPQHRMARVAATAPATIVVGRRDGDRLRCLADRLVQMRLEQRRSRCCVLTAPSRSSAASTTSRATASGRCTVVTRTERRRAAAGTPRSTRRRRRAAAGWRRRRRPGGAGPGSTSMVVSSDRLIRSSIDPSWRR